MFALIFSAIWWDVQRDQAGIQSLVGLIFMAVVNTAFSNTQVLYICMLLYSFIHYYYYSYY